MNRISLYSLINQQKKIFIKKPVLRKLFYLFPLYHIDTKKQSLETKRTKIQTAANKTPRPANNSKEQNGVII